MIPVVFINCRRHPFLDQIISGRKSFETRTRDMLRSLVGQRVLLAETGRGRPVVRCSALIEYSCVARSRAAWETVRNACCIPEGSVYDWQPDTKIKHLYWITDVVPVPVPFTPPEGVRHGRVWMEYNND